MRAPSPPRPRRTHSYTQRLWRQNPRNACKEAPSYRTHARRCMQRIHTRPRSQLCQRDLGETRPCCHFRNRIRSNRGGKSISPSLRPGPAASPAISRPEQARTPRGPGPRREPGRSRPSPLTRRPAFSFLARQIGGLGPLGGRLWGSSMKNWRIRIEGELRPDRLSALSALAQHAISGDTPLGGEEARDIAFRLESVIRALPQYENVSVRFGVDALGGPAGITRPLSWKSRAMTAISKIPCPRGVRASISRMLESKRDALRIPTISIVVEPSKEPTRLKVFAKTSPGSPAVELGVDRGDFRSFPGFSSGSASVAVSLDARRKGHERGTGERSMEHAAGGGQRSASEAQNTPNTPNSLSSIGSGLRRLRGDLHNRVDGNVSASLAKHLVGARYNVAAGLSTSADCSSECPLSLGKREVYLSVSDIWPGFNTSGIQAVSGEVSVGREVLQTPLGVCNSRSGTGGLSILDLCIPSCFRMAYTQSASGVGRVSSRKGSALASIRWAGRVSESAGYASEAGKLFGTAFALGRLESVLPLSRNTQLALNVEASTAITTARGLILLQERAMAPEIPGFFGRRLGLRTSEGINTGGDAHLHGRLKLESYLVDYILRRLQGPQPSAGTSGRKNVWWRLLQAASGSFLVVGADAAAVANFTPARGCDHASSVWAGLGASVGRNKYVLAAGLPLAGSHDSERAFGLIVE